MHTALLNKIVAIDGTKEKLKAEIKRLEDLTPEDKTSYEILRSTQPQTLKKLDKHLSNKLNEIKSARQAISDIHGFYNIMSVLWDQKYGFTRFILDMVLEPSIRKHVRGMIYKDTYNKLKKRLPPPLSKNGVRHRDWDMRYQKEIKKAIPRDLEVKTKQAVEIISATINCRKAPENYTEFFTKNELMKNLIKVLQHQVPMLEAQSFFRKDIKSNKKEIIEKLYKNKKLTLAERKMFEDNFQLYVKEVTRLIRKYIFGRKGKLFILGDSIDRGPAPDLLVEMYKAHKDVIKYVWGNHDILAMGAAMGCEPMVAECLRIAMRYENQEFMKRMGFDLSALDDLIFTEYGQSREELMGPDAKKPGAKTNPKAAIFAWREHALHIIQEKMAHQLIEEFKDILQMDDRLLLPDLKKAITPGNMNFDEEGNVTMPYKGQNVALRTSSVPTVKNVKKAYTLTKGEKAVMNSFSQQLIDNPVFRMIAEYFFQEGAMYREDDNVLFVHNPPPCDADGNFITHPLFNDLTGKAMFDYLDAEIKAIGKLYCARDMKKITRLQKAMMYYLWCGAKSPLFGKDAMKTFEVAFFKDEKLHKERAFFGPKGLQNPVVLDAILEAFKKKALVFGHTPTDKKDEIVMGNGRASNVDSGFIKDHPGRCVIITATGAYLIELIIPQAEMEQYRKGKKPFTKDMVIDVKYTILKTWNEPRRFKNMPESDRTKDLQKLVKQALLEQGITEDVPIVTAPGEDD